MSHMRFWKVAVQIASFLVFIACFASPSSAAPGCTVQVTPTAGIFGPEDLGKTTPSQTFTFTEITGVPCQVTSVSLGGTDPDDFREARNGAMPCPAAISIVPGGCTVGVSFRPLATGTRTATLTFTYTSDGITFANISVNLVGGDPILYVSTQGGGQLVKVDAGTGDFSPIYTNTSNFSPEGTALGPDNKLYSTDHSNGRILRMNQDGTQFETVYDVSQSRAAGPLSPRGPSFSSSSSGDLYFTSDWNEGDCVGVFRIAGVATTSSIPTPLTPTNVVNGTCPGQSGAGFLADSGRDTAFDSADNLNFVQSGANGTVAYQDAVVSVNPATYVAGSNPNTVAGGQASPLNNPNGIALNTATGQMFVADRNSDNFGKIDVINSDGTTSMYIGFNNNSVCNNLPDLPTFMQFDGTGNLYVVTSTDPTGGPNACGRVWRISPPCVNCSRATLLLDFHMAHAAGGSGLVSDQAIGLAMQSSGTQAPPQTTGTGNIPPVSSSGGSFTVGWPQGCMPGSNGDIGTCIHTYGLTYPAGMFATGDMVTVIPTYISQADWAARTPTGSPYAGTNIAPIAGYGGSGVIYSVSCTNPNAVGHACATPPATNYYTTESEWKSTNTTWCSTGIGGNNPGMLKSEASTPNTFQDVLIFCGDGGPKHIGGSGPTLSEWGNVSGVTGAAPTITIISPADGATYNQNQVVPANYSCAPPIAANCFGGPDLVNGTATVQNGSPVDTSTVATHFFEVTGDVISGPGGSAPGRPAAGSGFTTVLVPKTATYTVVPAAQMSATPANVYFGAFHVPGFGFQFVTVKNIGAAPLSISSVKVTSVSGKDSDDFFALSLCPRTLGAGKSCFILLGFFADEVTANNPQMANLVISATGGSVVVPLSATVVKR
jgi:hypothetical protein